MGNEAQIRIRSSTHCLGTGGAFSSSSVHHSESAQRYHAIAGCLPALPALYLKPENSTNVTVQDAITVTSSANVTYLVNLKLMMY